MKKYKFKHKTDPNKVVIIEAELMVIAKAVFNRLFNLNANESNEYQIEKL